MTPMQPGLARTIVVRVLLRSFARAFDVEAPSVRGLGSNEALVTYRTFTAACMEMALQDALVHQYLRLRLREEAMGLGKRVRMLVPSVFAPNLARTLYRAIGIDLVFEGQGRLRFASCMFADRYSPKDCWFMSAFDEGFLCGILGIDCGELRFSCRLTEGAPCCMAALLQNVD